MRRLLCMILAALVLGLFTGGSALAEGDVDGSTGIRAGVSDDARDFAGTRPAESAEDAGFGAEVGWAVLGLATFALLLSTFTRSTGTGLKTG